MTEVGKKCSNPKCKRRGQVLPYSQFYERSGYKGRHENGAGYSSWCIECMLGNAARQREKKTLETTNPTQKAAIDYLVGNKIFAAPGKTAGLSGTSVVAWGCVRLIVRMSYLDEAGRYIFKFSPVQKDRGANFDLIMLICIGNGDRRSHHLFDSLDQVFHFKNGRQKDSLIYTPVSGRHIPKVGLHKHHEPTMTDADMLRALDRLELIEQVRQNFVYNYGDLVAGE